MSSVVSKRFWRFSDWDMSDFLKYVGGTAGAVTLGALTAGAAAWYMMSRVPPPRLDVPIDDQSQKVLGTAACRMSRYCVDGKLMVRGFDDIFTCLDMFRLGMERSNDGQALGWRDGNGPYQWLKFSEVLERAKHVGAGMLKVGLKPVNTTHVGIYSQNKLEYMLTELGCYNYSMVVVPLYDTLGIEACTFIINQANLEMVMCDKADRVHKLMEHRDQTPNLKYIITADGILPEDVEKAKQYGVQIIKFADLEKMGIDNPTPPMPAQADDLAVVCYTSGTTGTPKGAMISHGNIVANVTGNAMVLCYLKVEPGDAMISYLPLAHMYERICQYVMFVNGGKVGFYRGDVKLLMDDIMELKPAVFPSVPRLLNRIYDKVMATVNSSRIKKMLFDMAMRSKLKDVRRGVARGGSIWDKIVFAKIQKSLGGNIKFIVSGSAPLSPSVLDFLRCAVGAAVVSEGYGQTECAAVATLQLEGEGEAGHVGPPIPSCMIKLVDVPEMNYFAKDNQGEVCIKGPIVFRGYLNQPDKTAEALDQDGWLHTGDIGRWTQSGALKVVDRKKHIFKLAQGEYIAPEKIENVLTNSQTVAQVFVHGDSLKASLVAVAVPDVEVFSKWAKEQVGVTGTLTELCENPKVKKAVLDELNKLGKSQGLSSYEQVRGLHLHPELFSIENGLLTPTFKTKRQAIVHHFQKEIEQMYKTLQ